MNSSDEALPRRNSRLLVKPCFLLSLMDFPSMNQTTTSTHDELRVIDICPLLPGHEAELAADILQRHRQGVVTDVAFMVPLVPEETVTSQDKAHRLLELLKAIWPHLEGSGLRLGLLIQSTLGHGTASDAPFVRNINAKGQITASMCPLDPNLPAYLREAVQIVAAIRPSFFLLDDDFRLANYGSPGCFCQVHLDGFAAIERRHYDRSELVAALANDSALRRRWDHFRLAGLLSLAKEIRIGIDAVVPDASCGYCVCDAGGMELHFAAEIAQTVAAAGQRPFVRINNAWYWNSDPRGLLSRIYWTSAQMAFLGDMAEQLAESDTYPHNRYYTPSRMLHAQIVYSLLHGCTGLKLWITRMTEYQPESGLAYRSVFSRHLGLYRELRQLVPHVTWTGPVTPLPNEPASVPCVTSAIHQNNWTSFLLARMGIPCRVGKPSATRTVMLTGPECDLFDDDEIRTFAAGSLLLDGAAAMALSRRGLDSLLGVTADLPEGWNCSLERFDPHPVNGQAAGQTVTISTLAAGSAVRLIPNHQATMTASTLYRVPFYRSPDETRVGAGLTLYESQAGGRIAVYAAILASTPFWNQERRRQLVPLLQWLEGQPLAVTVESDTDVFVRHGVIDAAAGGGELLAIFNLHIDSLDEVRLRCGERLPATVSQLEPDGSWRLLQCPRLSENHLTVPVHLEAADSLVLRLTCPQIIS